jgi:ferredoxin
MIMAKPKPIEEIINEIKDFNKVLIAGCDGCVTVCEAGGGQD